MGKAVPTVNRNRSEDVSPGEKRPAIVEKKNADSPNPESTSPVVDALCRQNQDIL